MTTHLPTPYLTVQHDNTTINTPSTTPVIISRIATPSTPSIALPSPSPDPDHQRGRKRLRVEDILLATTTKPSPSKAPNPSRRPAAVHKKSTDSSLETFRGRARRRSTSFPPPVSTSASTPGSTAALSRALSLSLSRRGSPSVDGGQQQQQQQQQLALPGTVRFLRAVQIERGRERVASRCARISPPAAAAGEVAAAAPRHDGRMGRRSAGGRTERRRRSQSPSRSRSPLPGPVPGGEVLPGLEDEGSEEAVRRWRRRRTRSRGREHGVGVGAGLVTGVGVAAVQVGCGETESGGGIDSVGS